MYFYLFWMKSTQLLVCSLFFSFFSSYQNNIYMKKRGIIKNVQNYFRLACTLHVEKDLGSRAKLNYMCSPESNFEHS